MAIVINGSGTITGISVGGLPDSIVDAGTLATNSVDSAELIDGAVDNSHMAAMAASKLTGALPAISGASLTNLPAAAATVACYAYTNSQSLANTTSTKIQFSSEHFDVGNDFDSSTNYRFTAPSAGKYLVITSMSCADSQMTAGNHFQIELKKNGSLLLYQNWTTSTNMRAQNIASRILDLSTSDYLEAYGYQSQGSTITIGFQNGTYICVYKLG